MRLKDTLTRIGVQSYELFVKTPKLLSYKKMIGSELYLINDCLFTLL